jgi:hypothetical protein
MVLLNSSISLYVSLLRSSQFGADRKRLDLRDVLSIPCPRLEELPASSCRQIQRLALEVLRSETLPLGKLDAFVGELLGLSPWDLDVVRDTLDTALPFKSAIVRAQQKPTAIEMSAFVETVEQLVGDVLVHFGRSIKIAPVTWSDGTPWLVLRIDSWRGRQPRLQDVPPSLLDSLMKVALDGGASRVVLRRDVAGSMVVGLFAQYRYWTVTQARLLALDLLGDPAHESWLRGET